MRKLEKILYLWLPVIFWCGLIFFVSSLQTLPKISETAFDVFIKNLAHFLEYAILFFLIQRALENKPKKFRTAFNLSTLYAFSDEFHQSFVPGRQPSLMDISIDIMGMLAVWLYLRKVKKK